MIGIKHSNEKLPYFTVLVKQFPRAIRAVVERAQQGHIKYEEYDQDWQNWDRVVNGQEEFQNAGMRHIFEEGEDSKLDHMKAAAWNWLAVLEKELRKLEEEKNKVNDIFDLSDAD